MAGTRPWVAWYPADILNDPKYLCLSRPARLCYRELLDRMWLSECALPNDPRKLAALVGITELEFQKQWAEMQDPADPCFVDHPDKPNMLTNRRLYKELQYAEQLAEISRENGKRGGRPPKPKNPEETQRDNSGVPRPNPDESYPHPQSQLQEEIKDNKSGKPDSVFEDFWTQYPAEGKRNASKKKARERWAPAVKRARSLDAIVQGMLAMKAQWEGRRPGTFVPRPPHPANFLSQNKWESDYSPPTDSTPDPFEEFKRQANDK